VRVNGKRGQFLLPLGVLHIVFGAAYIFPETTASTARSVGFLIAWGIPVWVAGIPWIVSGLAAVAAAFVKAPPGRDGWGFQALASVEAAWAGVFGFSWAIGVHPRGWLWSLVFVALAWAVLTVSGMVDPRRLTIGS
jgi:hypothetical protein